MSLRILLATAALCFGAATATTAHAKVGVINTGNELFEVAEFPADIVSEVPALKEMKAGYKCDRLGFMWADIWTWNCEIVALKSADDNGYGRLPADITAKLAANPAYAYGNAKRGFWNHYAFWTALALIAAMGLYGMVASKKETDDVEPTPA